MRPHHRARAGASATRETPVVDNRNGRTRLSVCSKLRPVSVNYVGMQVDMTRPVDVAVVDEVQMLASPDRGWAWTRALLGLPATEIHLCGEERSVELLRRLCDLCGDTIGEPTASLSACVAYVLK
jgi:hypothetical protein